MAVKEGKAYQYAAWCVLENEGKVPRYVKKQAESWMKIVNGQDPDAVIDEEANNKICRLLKIINHPDLQCPIYDGLEDYAWLLIIAVMCTKCRNTVQNVRFYTTAVLEIARKNFKTFNSAVIFILLMLTEPNFSRFFSVAPDLALSSELKGAIRKIIKVSPALYDEIDPAFKILRSQIICILNDNEYTPLAYDKMIAVNKAESEQKIKKAIRAIDDMGARGLPISVTELVRWTGLSRGFFYKNVQVRQKLEEAIKQPRRIDVQQPSEERNAADYNFQELKKDFNSCQSENQRLKAENEQLLQKCSILQKEVDTLKKRLDRKEIALLKKL